MPVSGEPSQAECRHASGLVAFSFQFFTRLGYVFAEEVGDLTATGARYGTTDTNLGLG